MIALKEIVIYPIKFIAGISVQKAYAGERGFENDRRWMLIDKQNKFITQRQHHQLALVQLKISGETIELSHAVASLGSTRIPLKISGKPGLFADIWDDQVNVIWPGLEADIWFSDYLGQACRLVYLPDESFRRVDPDYVSENVNTSLSDGYPYLLANRASLRDIEIRAGVSLSMTRFRPNLVVEAGDYILLLNFDEKFTLVGGKTAFKTKRGYVIKVDGSEDGAYKFTQVSDDKSTYSVAFVDQNATAPYLRLLKYAGGSLAEEEVPFNPNATHTQTLNAKTGHVLFFDYFQELKKVEFRLVEAKSTKS